MMHLGVFVELLAIIALIADVPIPIAGTVALVAATPTSAVAILRILKTEKTALEVVNAVFLFSTWLMLPCLLVQYATDDAGDNVFRFTVAVRIFAAATIWRLSSRWNQRSTGRVIQSKTQNNRA